MDVVLTQEFLGSEDEADLVEWLVENGASVVEGDVICQLETSKVASDFSAPAAGVLKHKVDSGDVVSVDDVFAVIE